MSKYVNTHELLLGDVVSYYGCKFRLTERRLRLHPDDLKYDTMGTSWFRTECVEYNEGAMPKSWANTWVIQGNSHAMWHVIESED